MIIAIRVFDDPIYQEETGLVLISRTNFQEGEAYIKEDLNKTVKLPGRISRYLLTSNLFVDTANVKNFVHDPKFVNGIKGQLFCHLYGKGLSHFAKVKSEQHSDSIEFFKIPASLCVVITTKYVASQTKILRLLNRIPEPNIQGISLECINHILFRSQSEELERTKGKNGLYEFKGFSTKYAGIAGLFNDFINIEEQGEFQGPICENIKEGDWLIEYHYKRLEEIPEIQDWFSKFLIPIKVLPPDLKPKYVFIVFSKLVHTLWKYMLSIAPEFFVIIINKNIFRVTMNF